jgi:peptidoglycan/xylan/chitin deacetylase (PgdA/CDA1 family)
MRLASLSLDLDNKWSYMKTHGDASWQEFPSYLGEVIPIALDIARQSGVRMTFFVVGQDAELEQDRKVLAALGETDHEIGNHSFHHEPWLHLKSPAEIRFELHRAHEAIRLATGKNPEGFRGPGFSLSRATLQTLIEMGYTFDCSTLPTFVGPLARAFYFRSAKLDPEERKRREKLFGAFSEGFRPNRPYHWMVGDRAIVEVPVTTMPLLRVPIHVSYVLYLARVSPWLADRHVDASLAACRIAGTEPSILLHPLDFLGGDDVTGLGFFPAMDMKGDIKRRLVLRYIERLSRSHQILPMGEHVKAISARDLPEKQPDFAEASS